MWIDIVKILIDVLKKTREADAEKRKSISNLYQTMSDLLAETATELSGDIYPAGKCSTMWSLSQNILEYIKDKISEEEVLSLSQMLHSCSQLEREYATRQDPETINKLIETAGHFKALSILYTI
jgi:hypothetical protein